MSATRDAFGRLIVDPQRLSREERVDIVRHLAGRLQAAASREEQWLGARLALWLDEGGDLVAVLGLRPERGSRLTAQAIVRAERCAGLMRGLAGAVGSAQAARILAGAAECPAPLRASVVALRELGAPTSRAAFTRARGAARHAR